MLYPDFKDLIAFKNRKLGRIPPPSQVVQSAGVGNYSSRFRGQGLEFDSVREYVPGDDIRRIDWRVTARTGAPHLKIFKEERERFITICVDMNATMRFGTRKTFKSIQAAHTAALLGWQGIAQQERVSACLFGDVPNGIQFFVPKRTRQSLFGMFKMLCEPSTEQHDIPLHAALNHLNQVIHTRSLVYLISDFMHIHQDSEIRLNQLRKKCNLVLIAINDQADQSLYPMGVVTFSRNEKETFTINTVNESGRKAYALQWEQNRQLLYAMTAKFNIPLLELTTESDLNRELVLGLKNITKRKNK